MTGVLVTGDSAMEMFWGAVVVGSITIVAIGVATVVSWMIQDTEGSTDD